MESSPAPLSPPPRGGEQFGNFCFNPALITLLTRVYDLYGNKSPGRERGLAVEFRNITGIGAVKAVRLRSDGQTETPQHKQQCAH